MHFRAGRHGKTEDETLSSWRESFVFLWKYVKPCRWFLLGVVGGQLLAAGAMLVVPALAKMVVDDVVGKGEIEKLPLYTGFMVGALLFSGISRYATGYVLNWVGENTVCRLRKDLFAKLLRYEVAFHDEMGVGKLVSRVANDVETVDALFSGGVVYIVNDVFVIIGVWIVMFLVSPRLTIALATFVPLLLVVGVVFQKVIFKVYSQMRNVVAEVNQKANEVLDGIEVVKAFVAERRFVREFKNTLKRYYRCIKSMFWARGFFHPFIDALYYVALFVLLMVGIKLSVTVGTILAFTQYLDRFFHPLVDLGNKFDLLQNGVAAGGKILDLMRVDREMEWGSGSRENGNIVFSDVSFSYSGREPVFESFDFLVGKDEIVGVVGPTGAGKSTLVALVMRYYDVDGGKVLYNGLDVREWDGEKLRKDVGYVPQDNFFFKGSLLENLLLKDDVTDEERERVLRAMRELGVDGMFAHRLEDEIAEGGKNLSEGEKQILSLLRVLVKKRFSTFIMDEGISSVDTITERIIQEGVNKLVRGRKGLVVAHRFSTLTLVDRIVVLMDGKIVEEGSFDELVEKKGVFYNMYKLQMGGV